MATLLEITSKLEELQKEIDSVEFNISRYSTMLQLFYEKQNVLNQEKEEYIQKKNMLEKNTILEKDKQEVLENLKVLSKLLNDKNVSQIDLTLCAPHSESKLIQIKVFTEITPKGIEYCILIHTNRYYIRDLIKENLLLPIYEHSEEGNRTQYWYSKDENPEQKIFKDIE